MSKTTLGPRGRKTLLGDIADIGRNIFGGVHTAGKILASAFGAGGAVQSLENLEAGAGLLPDWAKSAQKTPPAAVTAPDHVVLQRKGQEHAQVIDAPVQVVVTGGARFDGNGYKPGDKNKFSFGYDQPQKIDVMLKGGAKTALDDVTKIVFLGGVEGKTSVSGLDADQVLGEVLGLDWQEWAKTFFVSPVWGTADLYNQYMNPAGSRAYLPQGAQNKYFSGLKVSSPFGTATQQRQQAAAALQQQLRAQQAANLAQMQSQLLPTSAMPTPSAYGAPTASIAIPDPNNPGYLTDGSPDPNYQTSVQGDVMDIKKLGDQVLGDVGEKGVCVVDDYVHGCDVIVGAAVSIRQPITHPTTVVPKGGLRSMATAGFVPIKGKPKGVAAGIRGIKLNKNAKHTSASILNNTRAIAKRAQQVGKKLLDASNKAAKNGKTHVVGAGRLGTHRPDFGVNMIEHNPLMVGVPVVVGATKVVPRLSPKAKLSPTQMKQLAQKLIDKGKALSGTADKYASATKSFKAAQKAAAQKGKAATHIIGADIVGDDGTWHEIMGAALQRDSIELLGAMAQVIGATQDPTTGLWLDPSGTPYPTDPASGMQYDPATGQIFDGSSGGATGGSFGGYDVPGPPDFGANALFGLSGPPTLNDVATLMQQQGDYAPDPAPDGSDQVQYTGDTLPLGFVVYDGSQQPPHMGLGNYTVFFGELPGGSIAKGGPNSGYQYHGDGKWWLLLTGQEPKGQYGGDRNYDTVDNPNAAMVSESEKNNWGPLIGNPQGGWTRGLRFSPNSPSELGGGPIWFWYFDTAPMWAKQGILQAKLNDLLTQYQAAVVAGQTDYTNAQVQAQLDAQTQDAINRQQAVSDAAAAQQMQQQQLQEAQYEQQMYQQQGQLQLQMQQQALQEQQMMDQYFQAHPEQMFVPVDQGYGGGGYGGGGGGDLGNPFAPDSSDQGIDWGSAADDGGAGIADVQEGLDE